MRSCYYISSTGHPALSVPGGFTPDGLPIGLQIVGKHQADFEALQVGYEKHRLELTKAPGISS
jgi:amidase